MIPRLRPPPLPPFSRRCPSGASTNLRHRPSFDVRCSAFDVRRSAFTLLELLLVLLLIATLSTLTLTTLASPLRRATLDDALARLAQIDHDTRTLARTTAHPVSLAFDLESNTVTRREPDRPPTTLLRLPQDIRLTAVRTPASTSTTEIPFNDQGLSPTYALRLDTPRSHRTLLIPGLTGAATQLSDPDLDTLFTALTPTAQP